MISSLLVLLVLSACSKQPLDGNNDSDLIEVFADASIQSTKTAMNNGKMSWRAGDNIGVFIQSIQSNVTFTNVAGTSFYGSFNRVGASTMKRELYAYYPYSNKAISSSDQTTVHMTMPYNQATPFDTSLDVMVADVGSIEYNESDMPPFSLSFNHHLFSILKINYVNNSATYQDQSVFCVHIESKTKILSGNYTFDVSDGASATAVFDGSSDNCKKYVNLSTSTNQKMGLGAVISVYALIPPGVYDAEDLSITIYTGDYKATVTNKKSMTLKSGTIHDLETISFSDRAVFSTKKTVLCFGDSITTGTVTDQLQTLLGYDDWLVYIAGVSGESRLQIMARQGTAPLYVSGGFTIPSHQEIGEFVNVSSGFLTTFHTDGTISGTPDNPINITLAYYTGNATYCGHTNPFLVKGVECEIQYYGSKVQIRRLSDGEPIDCSFDDFVQIIPCAAWKYGTPTVTTIYMGTNGNPASQVLSLEYDRVKQNVNPKGFIGVGYHHGYWSTTYKTTMYNTLGVNYLDLRTEGCAKADTIMKSMGLKLTEQDNINISNNIWPQSWGGLDVHPNTTGAKAHAYLIYYKMKELGYLDD